MADKIIAVLDECISPENCPHQTDREKISALINKVIDYIGKEVDYLGEEVQLSWQLIESYLNEHKPDGEHLYALIMAVFKQHFSIEELSNDHLVNVKFKEQQSAIAFHDFLLHILPLINTEYSKITPQEIIITDEQHYFCNRFAQHGTGKLDARYLKDCLLKTLRADAFDFSYQFILGIIPGENGARRHQNLRPKNREAYTVTPKGRIALQLNKPPMYTPEEKNGFSQIQSCTLIDEETLSCAFGFTKERSVKLYGLMTHIEDARINRMLLNDSGTVSRIFEFSSSDQERSTRSNYQKIALFYPPEKMDDFKRENLKERTKSQRTNEILARLRFNPYRSVVSICSDTLEARLLAYDFAQELLEHFAAFAKSNGAQLNPHFKIPIIFYVANPQAKLKHELRFYTPDMRKKDELVAGKILNDIDLRSERVKNHHYEFLLGLTTDDFLASRLPSSDINPLATEMIDTGYVRMLLRAFRHYERTLRLLPASDQHKLKVSNSAYFSSLDNLFKSFLDRNLIKKNDAIIGQLILVEAFDIAEMLITATNSDKYQLSGREGLLVDYLIKNGNPRQMNYIGLDRILMLAAKKNQWVSIKLCLKEFPGMSKVLLGQLLVEACHSKCDTVATSLLEMGADRTQRSVETGRTAIAIAVLTRNWLVASHFSQYPTDAEDRAGYGFAVIVAIIHRQLGLVKCLLLAGAKPTWRSHYDWGHELNSTLFYAVKEEFDELLPDLIKHEQDQQGELSDTRCRLALNLAYKENNAYAIELFTASFSPISPIDPHHIERSICRLVLEALATGDVGVAEQELLCYLHQEKLLAEDNNNVADGLSLIMDYFDAALPADSAPTLPYNRALYAALLRNINAAVFSEFKDAILRLEQAKRWHDLLTETFEWAIKCYYTVAIELLMEIDISCCDLERLIRVAAEKNDPRLLKLLLDNFSFSDSTKNEILNILINGAGNWVYSHTTENRNTNITLLLTQHNVSVTPELLRTWINRIGLSLPLLNAIDKTQYFDLSYRSAFAKALECPYYSAGINEKLVSMLGEPYIRHLTLINLLGSYWRSCQFTVIRDAFSLDQQAKIDKAISIEGVHGGVTRYWHSTQFANIHVEILNTLGDYFSEFNHIPEEAIIISTFKKILNLFENLEKQSSSRFFFKRKHGSNEFNRRNFQHLQLIDQLIIQCQKDSINIDAPTQPQFIIQSDTNVTGCTIL